MNFLKSNKIDFKLVNLGYSILVIDKNEAKSVIKNILQNRRFFFNYLILLKLLFHSIKKSC